MPSSLQLWSGGVVNCFRGHSRGPAGRYRQLLYGQPASVLPNGWINATKRSAYSGTDGETWTTTRPSQLPSSQNGSKASKDAERNALFLSLCTTMQPPTDILTLCTPCTRSQIPACPTNAPPYCIRVPDIVMQRGRARCSRIPGHGDGMLGRVRGG